MTGANAGKKEMYFLRCEFSQTSKMANLNILFIQAHTVL